MAGVNVVGFVVASFVMLAVPGPAVLFIVTRALDGMRSAAATIAGLVAGLLPYVVVAAFGVSEVLLRFPSATLAIRLAGAAYLGWLSYRALSTPQRDSVAAIADGTAFRDGFVVNIANPQMALFFVAFFPQFVRRTANARTSAFVLVLLFVLIAICTDLGWIFLTHAVATRLTSFRRWFPYLSATSYAALAIFAVATAR